MANNIFSLCTGGKHVEGSCKNDLWDQTGLSLTFSLEIDRMTDGDGHHILQSRAEKHAYWTGFDLQFGPSVSIGLYLHTQVLSYFSIPLSEIAVFFPSNPAIIHVNYLNI